MPIGSPVFFAVGQSNKFWAGALLPLPAQLTSWGMPGCWLFTDILAMERLASANGTATWAPAIPASGPLLGAKFYVQGFVADPRTNSMGLTVSNAGAATLGAR